MTTFSQITLTGKDNAKFLQGQLTIDVNKLTDTQTPCAISDLKGRVYFGLWAYKAGDDFVLISASDMIDELTAHIKKYAVFSKVSLSNPVPIYPCVIDDLPAFCYDVTSSDFTSWAKTSIAQGNYWITADTKGLFQPQELRLHQRGGVDYDKGCYLGQEIIARLYFKATPKAYLHRIHLKNSLTAGQKLDKVQVVNTIPTDDGFEALVIGSPENILNIGQILPLPPALSGSVARQK